MTTQTKLHAVAAEIYNALAAKQPVDRIVLAESCTGGLAAASLVTVPGISEYFCGSSVVYRPSVKTAWLGVPQSLLERHTAESAEVTVALATAALQRTPDATLAAAITGHLQLDEVRDVPEPHVFVALARRTDDGAIRSSESKRSLHGQSRAELQGDAALAILDAVRASLLDGK